MNLPVTEFTKRTCAHPCAHVDASRPSFSRRTWKRFCSLYTNLVQKRIEARHR